MAPFYFLKDRTKTNSWSVFFIASAENVAAGVYYKCKNYYKLKCEIVALVFQITCKEHN